MTPKSLIPPPLPPLPFHLSQVINNDLYLDRNNHSHNKDFFSVFYFYAGSSFHLLFSSGYTENFTFQWFVYYIFHWLVLSYFNLKKIVFFRKEDFLSVRFCSSSLRNIFLLISSFLFCFYFFIYILGRADLFFHVAWKFISKVSSQVDNGSTSCFCKKHLASNLFFGIIRKESNWGRLELKYFVICFVVMTHFGLTCMHEDRNKF